MAYFNFESKGSCDCLLLEMEGRLNQIGIEVIKSLSNSNQIFAHAKTKDEKYKAIVKIIISWSDRPNRLFSVEVRSDEPHLSNDTYCKKVCNLLKEITVVS